LVAAGKANWRFVASGAIVLTLIDLWPVNYQLVDYTPKSQFDALFKEEGIATRLEKDQDKFRIYPMIAGVRPRDPRYSNANWWSIFGLESVGGYFGAKLSGYQQFSEEAGLDSWTALYRNPEILDVLNVRYVITTVPLDQLFAELERQGFGRPGRPADYYGPAEITTSGGGFLYRNPGEMPRARLADNFKVISDLNATFKEIANGQWDPRSGVILDVDPPVSPVAGGAGSVKIESYKPEEIIVKTATEQPKLLVLADSYYPSGWSARVDGQLTPILRADGVLRAISLPAGDHTVKFSFSPKRFYAGLWISVITLLLIAGIGAGAYLKSRSSKQPEASA